MDEVSRGLDFVYVYIDDILIASTKAPKSIYDYFSTVFDSIVLLSTQLNPFLAFHFSSSLDTKLVHSGIQPLESNVKAIRDFSLPTSLTKL